MNIFMEYLTIEEVIQIHDDIVNETGGHGGIISFGNLDFTVDQTKIPKEIERAATILFYGILSSHPFVDGNKRTALEATKTFLALNERQLLADQSELWNMIRDTSEGKLKFEEIVIWIKGRLR